MSFNDHILVTGGLNHRHEILKTVERYDDINDEWTLVCSMNVRRCNHGFVNSGGKLLVIGGMDYSLNGNSQNTNTVEKYDVETDSWAIEDYFPSELSHFSTVSIEN